MDELAAATNRSWRSRLVGGVARRVRAAWRRWNNEASGFIAERTLAWLAEWADANAGDADAAEAWGAIAALAEFGEPGLARSLLVRVGDADSPSLWSMAHRVRACWACHPEGASPTGDDLVALLAKQLRAMLNAAWSGESAAEHEPGCPSTAALFAAATLAQARGADADSEWTDLAQRIVGRALRRGDPGDWDAPSPLWGLRLEALWELGRRNLAAGGLARAWARQTRGGAMPALPDADWIAPSGVAKLAELGFRSGQTAAAERALRWLERRRLASGAWPTAIGRGRELARRESAWCAIHYLRAARARVAATFAARDVVPESIGATDGRLRAVEEWAAEFPPGARIADVGCGNGRFLRRLVARFPRLNFVGVDPSPVLLGELPATVTPFVGALPKLPLAEASFDGVFAVESLEHALAPRQSVGELLRILRPGGRLLILDKRRDFQPLSLCERWERWFLPEDFRAWLADGAEDVAIRSVAHGNHVLPTGLFLCVTARRRAAANQQAA